MLKKLRATWARQSVALTLAPRRARGPPFFKTRVVRRKLGEADDDARQQEMFSA
jgi:hypothetical protein